MALLFFDGFDHYGSNQGYLKGWSELATPSISNGNGRYGTDGVNMWGGQYWRKITDNLSTFIIGVAYKPSGSQYFLTSHDSSTVQLQVYYNYSTGELQVMRGTTSLGTSTLTMTTGVWNYVELKGTIHNSTGSFELRVNGVTYLSASGIDTSNSGNEYANKFGIANTSGTVYFDDFYICDDSGSINNDFLGDVRVETLYPNGAGNETDWTPSTGSNWENVDDADPDDDSTYNYVGSGGGFPMNDLYTLGNLDTTLGDVYGIQINSYTRKDDAGSVSLANILRTGGTTYSGMGQVSLGDTYDFMNNIVEENPDTSSQWTVAQINSLETGIRRVS